MKKLIIPLLFLFFSMSQAQTVKTVSTDWTSISQTIAIQTSVKKKFKVTAYVKVETTEPKSWAGVWARVDTKNDEDGFFDNMRDRPVKSKEWNSYTVEGTVDKNSKSLSFGGLCLFDGKFYFDKFELFIENDKGVYEPVTVLNSSFESPISNGDIPKWIQGISNDAIVKVKEYKITSDKSSVDGKNSLLIEGKGIKPRLEAKIGNVEGASPKIADMISMLEDLKARVERTVKNMSQYEIDYLHDAEANRIGALVMHLAAAEKYYQVFTFENRDFNEEEKKKWGNALDLDQGGRDEFKGHDIQYYLDIYNEVRAKTIEELKKRDDAWFAEVQTRYDWTNQYCWFHVMEHQSSHLGQILFLKKRIPPEQKKTLPQEIKK
ncbi:DinB family protein [Flavobacterium ginsenosidimutans]|uniref:DinB family protein n=1 Tax=Flavobacterium ginsenosidimutans TaxID=687844 RepID=UPI003D986E6D